MRIVNSSSVTIIIPIKVCDGIAHLATSKPNLKRVRFKKRFSIDVSNECPSCCLKWLIAFKY